MKEKKGRDKKEKVVARGRQKNGGEEEGDWLMK